MKRISKIGVVLIALSSLFFGCKKYPEDGVRYWFNKNETPEKRISGTWRITKYYINGADSTAFLYKQYIGLCIWGYNSGSPCYQYGIIDLVVAKLDPTSNSNPFNISNMDAFGAMQFVNDDNYLKMEFFLGSAPSSFNAYNPFVVNYYIWKIEELTNLNLKITNTINNISYRIEFVKL